MQSHQLYKPNAGFSLLLIGKPFTGKTNAAMQFPDPYIFDADGKMQNAIDRLPADKVFWYDSMLVNDKGQPVTEDQQWTHATNCIKEAIKSGKPKTLILDSLTSLANALMAHILAQPMDKGALKIAGHRAMSQQEWTPFKMLMTKLIMMCKASGIPTIVCCHEQAELNESGSTIAYNPLIPGALKDALAGMFTDVWRCENRTGIVMEGTPPKPVTKTSYFCRTQPMPLMTLGNSLGLPAEYVLEYKDIAAKLAKFTEKLAPQPETVVA